MICGVLWNEKEDSALLEKQIRLEAAYVTDERVIVAQLYTREQLQEFLEHDNIVDIICVDVSILHGVAQAEELRKHYPKAVMILVADIHTSPLSYMKPSILAAALLIKPLSKETIRPVMEEIFHRFIEINRDEEIFLIETREEKQRIPLAEILYFEAREKKLYACTKHQEFGFYDTMDALQERMQEHFIRCHRSYLVNKDQVRKVMLSKNLVLLKEDIEIPLSRSYKSAVKQIEP